MPRGRPREFDTEQALDHAADVFRRQGYEGTSIANLIEELGVSAPSLYAAFGNKRQIFDRVMDRYLQTRLVQRAEALALDDPVEATRRYLAGVVLDATMPGHPRGCLTVGGALVCSDANRDVADQLAVVRTSVRTDFQRLFARVQEAGLLAAHADPAALGAYVAIVAQGISVEASGGASKEILMTVVDVALSALSALTTSSDRSATRAGARG